MHQFRSTKQIPKPIEGWTTEDLTPFRCPHSFECCLSTIARGASFVTHFFYAIEVRLLAIAHGTHGIIIYLTPDIDRYKHRPLSAAQILVDNSEYSSRVDALDQFDFILQLNSHLLALVQQIRQGDSSLIYDSNGEFLPNLRAPGAMLAKLRRDSQNTQLPKRWWQL